MAAPTGEHKMTSLYSKSIEFATAKHQGQTRKVSGAPYVTHPIAVAELVKQYKPDSSHLDELLTAAVLHDTLEDTNTTFNELSTEFSPLIASLTLELTNDNEKIKQYGKKEYQAKKMLNMSSYGLVIKLCDRLHNLMDSPTIKMIKDTIDIINILLSKRHLTKTHTAIINDIQKVCIV